MPEPEVGEKFLIQVRKRRNKPSASFTIEVIQAQFGGLRYTVKKLDYPNSTRTRMRRELVGFYWAPDNPPSWWDSGSWPRLLVKAVKDRRERMDRALRPTT
jgi:hypothetical protein